MAQKAKAKPTNNKNLIISACIAVVVVAVVAVAIFFIYQGNNGLEIKSYNVDEL